jgi:putative hydrolase of the HAD superfamily
MKAIAFDIYGTLLNIEIDENRLNAYNFLSQWLSCHGLSITPVDLKRQYKMLCQREMSSISNQHPDIEIGRVFSAIIQNIAGSGLEEESPFVEEFALLFRMVTTVHLLAYPGVEAMLTTLGAKTRLGVISNGQRLFTIPELKRLNWLHFFNTIVFSSDIQASKPNSMIFRHFLDLMKAKAEDVVFVGDNIEADVCGAQQIGMKTIWLNRDGHSCRHNQCAILPDVEISHLDWDRLTEEILKML